MSASCCPAGTTIMSHVLVPMILTSVPGAMPAPTPPRWASKAPTATGIPAGRPVLFAQSSVSPPTARSIANAVAVMLTPEDPEEFLRQVPATLIEQHSVR